MTLLGASLILATTGGALSALAWLSRRSGRPWAVLEAVLLGPGASRRASGVDLRFAAFAAAVGVLVAGVVGLLPAARALRGGTLGFALLLGLPALVGALAVLADLSAQAWTRLAARAATPATGRRPAPEDDDLGASPRPDDDDELRDLDTRPLPARSEPQDWDEDLAGSAPTRPPRSGLLDLLEEARAEVAAARELVRDPALRAALDALEESAVDYSHAAAEAGDEDDSRVTEMRARVEGVIALTRSCLDEDRQSAARLLGVHLDATPDQVRDVAAALRGVYGGLSLPGIDPGHLHLIERACDRLCAPPAASRAAA